MNDTDAAKHAAAEVAASLVEPGMIVGLGSGSTVQFVLEALGRRVRAEGLSITGVPTSSRTGEVAQSLGIPLAELAGLPLDLAIDGADEVEMDTLRLIKGLGGALLREKIVAQASRRFVVVADESKLVHRLGTHAPLPVEVDPFGHVATARRLIELGGGPALRLGKDGGPFVSDGGNLIYDCKGFGPILDPFTLELRLHAIAGVVETGLFLHMAERAIIGAADGSTSERRPR
jgi:ribose 5-phosphate isomerase A